MITPATIKKWEQDLRKMTKVYRELPTDHTPENVIKFEQTRKWFRNFKTNWEEFVYKQVLPPTDEKTETFSHKNVRVDAWNALFAISHPDMFPTAWDSRDGKYHPDFWNLQRRRDTNVSRYQRAFTQAFKSIYVYIGEGSENRGVKDQFNMAGATIIINHHGGGKWEIPYIKETLSSLSTAFSKITAAGFKEAIQGLVVHFDLESRKDLIGGQYFSQEDRLVINPLGLGSIDHSSLVHEIGHRLWFRNLTNRARAHWNEIIGARQSKIGPDVVKLFVKDILEPIYDPYRYFTNKELIQLVERKKDKYDSITFAQLRYLADHNPGSQKGVATPEEALDLNLKFNVGESVSMEHISDYGATSPIEAFAEAFKAYIIKGPRALGPWTRDFFEKITHGGKLASAKKGDCYEAAGKYLISPGAEKNLLLVHGEVTGQGPLEGVNFGHAWLEYGDTVIDVSNGRNIRIPKSLYYMLGHIAENDNMKTYKLAEARRKILQYKNWGPWDLQTSTGL